MVPISNTSCSDRSVSSVSYKVKNMAKFDPKAQAAEIADDHYAYLNATFGAKYKDAVLAAEISVEKVIEALQGMKATKKQQKSIEQWREVLGILRQKDER